MFKLLIGSLLVLSLNVNAADDTFVPKVIKGNVNVSDCTYGQVKVWTGSPDDTFRASTFIDILRCPNSTVTVRQQVGKVKRSYVIIDGEKYQKVTP